MATGDKFIALGAQLKCNQTQLPVPSVFNCVNPLHQINGQFVGTELDFIPVFNVPPFPSPCNILTAAAAGVPTPCVPFPTPWQGTHSGFMSVGRRLLLTSSYSYCVFGGKIELSSAGQAIASLGGGASFTNALVTTAASPNGPVLVFEPGDATKGWNDELNRVPLVANARYLVGKTLYETDDEGRVIKVRGVLTLSKHDRNIEEQTAVPRLKDGKENKAHKEDKRTDLEKKKKIGGQKNQAHKEDKRSWLERREFLDDGGHLRGAQFDGAGEQINYVSQDMEQNQRRRNAQNWFAMENNWAKELGKSTPSNVYMEQSIRYPNAPGSSPSGESMRPDLLRVKHWINGEAKTERFPQ